MKLIKLLMLIIFFVSIKTHAQTTVSGSVLDEFTLNPIEHVSIINGVNQKLSETDSTGYFNFQLPIGNYMLSFAHPDYQTKQMTITINDDKPIELGSIYLSPKITELNPVIISSVTDFITDDQLPVTKNQLSGLALKDMSSNNDLPGMLNQVPSVYATKQGGGIGDSRINIRGFEQRNVAVLINGVPVNDMQTGWVYWSNWLNLPDISTNVQLQPGMGASKLAIPSVGGTINIVTASAAKKQGGNLSYKYSSFGLNQLTAGYNTGILDNGLSASVQFGKIAGNGYVDKTDMSGYTYYLNLGYMTANQKHQLMFNVIDAPQWHYQHNKASKLQDYLTYSDDNQPNIKYNSEWGYLNGEAYSWSKNYFHKPIASLNWDWQIKNDLNLSSVVYAMFGRGGGTGPIGAINYQYPFNDIYTGADGQVRFDDIYTWNNGGHVPDFGPDRQPDANGMYVNKINEGLTRYAFMNNHGWLGSVFNLNKQFSDKLTLSGGFDLRKTYGKNTLAVNDVLGANAYLDQSDVNHPNTLILPSDFVEATYDWNPFKPVDDLKKIIFFNQANINWGGAFIQSKYETEKIAAFLQAGLSEQGFQKIDYFSFLEGDQKSEWVYLPGGNIKVGFGYHFNKTHQAFLNAGFFSKQPLFNAVFPYWGSLEPGADLQNEKVYSFETGYQFKNNHWQANLNVYYTVWKDRYQTVTDFVNNQQVSGVLNHLKEVHKGIEFTSKANYGAWRLYTMFSLGDWYYEGNSKNISLYNFQQQVVTVNDYYLDGVKVGNAAQMTAFLKLQYNITNQWRVFASQFYADKLFAKIDVSSFSTPNHKGSLELPAYSLVDAGTTYKFKVKNFGSVNLRFSIQNLFDKHYISESDTNIFPDANSNTWHGVNTQNRIFFGWGRTWQFGVDVKF